MRYHGNVTYLLAVVAIQYITVPLVSIAGLDPVFGHWNESGLTIKMSVVNVIGLYEYQMI